LVESYVQVCLPLLNASPSKGPDPLTRKSLLYRPSTEKYSVLQRDIYTEYKSLFDGSTVGCWSGSQVVKLCREMWPDTALGRRLDNPSEFRIWGIYRVRILPQSPWELLYSGQLKAELFNLVEAKPTEQFKSETLVARMGAPLASMASILSTARLDQTKISTLSAIANKSDLDTFTQKLLRERNTSLWEVSCVASSMLCLGTDAVLLS
jgi:hypothetical protein